MTMNDEMVTLGDGELLLSWRAGNARAGMTLVERHHESVLRFFLHKVGPGMGPDLAQATFLGLLEGIDRFRGESSFRTWLFAVARNVLFKHLRDRCRDEQRFDPEVTSVEALEPSPTRLMAVADEHRLLLAALRRLPIDTQLMLELHYWERLSVADIAVVLDLPISTVKTRMRRGRLRLNEWMTELAESREQLESTQRGLDAWAAALRREIA